MSFRSFALLALGLWACSGSDAGVAPTATADLFVGNYLCTATTNLVFSSPPGTPANVATATSGAAISANQDGSITATAEGVVGTTCALVSTISGNTATLQAGQSCTVANDGTTLLFVYSTGTATLANDVVTASSTFSFTGSDSALALAGSGTATEVCTRE
jgi:hypothetical protein